MCEIRKLKIKRERVVKSAEIGLKKSLFGEGEDIQLPRCQRSAIQEWEKTAARTTCPYRTSRHLHGADSKGSRLVAVEDTDLRWYFS